MNRWCVNGSGQGRLASRFIGEGELRRVEVQVAAQNPSEKAASQDEPVAVAFELKSRRAVAFAGGERFGKGRQIGSQLIQPGAPDMDFLVRQVKVRGWKGPVRFGSGDQAR